MQECLRSPRPSKEDGYQFSAFHNGDVATINTIFWSRTLLVVTALITFVGISFGAEGPSSQSGVPPELVADYIHAVIEADRTLYTTHVVNRMQKQGKVIASELWKKRGQLPLPAQMLKLAGREVEAKGIGLKYRLASLWPIREENTYANAFERAGLEVVVGDPGEVYSGIITRGNLKYFKAIYADKAVSPACINCHNAHPLSPKRNFKLGSVMGAIIISFPVE